MVYADVKRSDRMVCLEGSMLKALEMLRRHKKVGGRCGVDKSADISMVVRFGRCTNLSGC